MNSYPIVALALGIAWACVGAFVLFVLISWGSSPPDGME